MVTTSLHQRGYHLGDMRCSNCKKWLNPNDENDVKEIRIGKRGMKLHDKRYCPIYSPYSAVLVMFAKFHSMNRDRLYNIKRY